MLAETELKLWNVKFWLYFQQELWPWYFFMQSIQLLPENMFSIYDLARLYSCHALFAILILVPVLQILFAFFLFQWIFQNAVQQLMHGRYEYKLLNTLPLQCRCTQWKVSVQSIICQGSFLKSDVKFSCRSGEPSIMSRLLSRAKWIVTPLLIGCCHVSKTDPPVCSARSSAYQTAACPRRYRRYLSEALTHMLLVSAADRPHVESPAFAQPCF